MKIQVEVMSQEFVKPSAPTPHHLRHLYLSLLDQLMPPVSMSFVHFYSNESTIGNSKKCDLLKKSLSDVLAIFYPLAGRVRDNTYIDCNDEGFLFVEARARCKLSHVLQDCNPVNNRYFTPFHPEEVNDLAGFSQITQFECGGLAISFGMSHKLGDANSKFMFLTSWAAMARGNTKEILTPTFGHAETFPPISMPKPNFGRLFSKENFISKIFVFDGSSIEALKAKHTNTRGNRRQLSRVEVVTGFILGRYIATTQTPKANKMKCVVKYAMDLRQRMELPMPKLSFGNMIAAATIEAQVDSKDKYCLEIVERIRDSAVNSAEYMKKNRKKPDQLLNLIKMTRETYGQHGVVSFTFTSLNKFPMYESDFGWGKPMWVGIRDGGKLLAVSRQSNCPTQVPILAPSLVGITPAAGKNIAYLCRTKDGEGIEACITSNEEDMAKFEADEHVLLHASSAYGRLLNAHSRL